MVLGGVIRTCEKSQHIHWYACAFRPAQAGLYQDLGKIWGQTLIIIIRKCEARTIPPKNASSQKNQQILSFQQKI